jgi:hypothetical protein
MLLDMREVMDEIGRLDSSVSRSVVPVRSLGFEQGCLIAGDDRLEVAGDHFASLCQAVGAPPAYLQGLGEPHLSQLLDLQFHRGDHVDWMMSRRLLGTTRRHLQEVAVAQQDGQFLGFGRADLLCLTGKDVVESVHQGVKSVFLSDFNQFRVANWQIVAKLGFSLDLVIDAVNVDAGVGDVILGGIHIEHSIFSLDDATRIDTYLHRIACLNGSIRRECVGTKGQAQRIRRHINRLDSVDQALSTITNITASRARTLKEKLDSVAKLKAMPVTDPIAFIRRQLQHVPRLSSKRTARLIETQLPNATNNLSQYDIWNAITHVATHNNNVSPSVRHLLLLLGGVIGTQANHVCQLCYSRLAT